MLAALRGRMCACETHCGDHALACWLHIVDALPAFSLTFLVSKAHRSTLLTLLNVLGSYHAGNESIGMLTSNDHY